MRANAFVRPVRAPHIPSPNGQPPRGCVVAIGVLICVFFALLCGPALFHVFGVLLFVILLIHVIS